MDSTAVAPHEYWGYLIKPDKSPTPVFEQLLLGVANYINHHVAPWDIHCLTPSKLAAFYRLVGGDYDPLFLDTPSSSLSFIYQSLGCFHTLQPDRDPYVAPNIPALTPQGFVRWQTVQLLLGPDEHVPFLQEAVKRFELLNPADGIPFPSILPKEALPTQPDAVLSAWHDEVTQRLMLEAQTSAARDLPPRPQMALSDISLSSSRDSSLDSHSVVGTDMAGYFAHPRPAYPSQIHLSAQAAAPPPPLPLRYPNEPPWSSQRRRRSLPDNNRGYPSSRPRDDPTPRSIRAPPPRTHTHQSPRPPHHVRKDSDISTISTSTSDSSSVTTSEASLSPLRYHARPALAQGGRRHSADQAPQRPASHPQGHVHHADGRERGKSVRWEDEDEDDHRPRFSHRDDRYGYRHRYGNGRSDERGRGRPARSVESSAREDGRRYVDRAPWR